MRLAPPSILTTILVVLASTVMPGCGASSTSSCGSDDDCDPGQRCITSGGIFFDRPVCVDDTGSEDCEPTEGGQEICDGVDNDCDGRVDEGPVPLETVTVGHGYACGTRSNGDALCWGTNRRGELGAGFTSEREDRPVRVDSNAEFAMLEGNPNLGRQTCGLTLEGDIYCWGQSVDQLGASADREVSTPTLVPAVYNNQPLEFDQISLGGFTICGLSRDRRVYCWGRNTEGQLGDGTTTPSTEPLQVPLSGTASYVSMGASHACATMDSGTAFCWGDNNFGQLGNGTTESPEAPVEIPAPSGSWQRVVAGDEFTCGLTSSDELYCWGRNVEGQLGLGSGEQANAPTLVAGGMDSGITTVAPGTYHACSLDGENSLECWGNLGDDGVELGIGSTSSATPQPVDFDGPNPIATISAGVLGSCLLTESNEAYCWGQPTGSASGQVASSPTAVACPSASQ